MQMSFRLTQEHRITYSHDIALAMARLQLRRDLVEAVHGASFSPRASCPACEHALTDYEIMKGFKDDPHDYTTGCPKCQHRFFPRLARATGSGSAEVAFFCPTQTLDQLPRLVSASLDDFRTTHAGIYNSAIVHFGGLRQAFKKIGLTYAYEADLDWRVQVVPFLGKMADTVIAELVGAPVTAVRKLRKHFGIAVYSTRQEVEDLAENLA